jgi:CHAT domain-containing protein/uncharacterized protein YaaW (UPF0174 family)
MGTVIVGVSKAYNKLYVEAYDKGEEYEHRTYSAVDISDDDIKNLCDVFMASANSPGREISLEEFRSFEANAKLLYDSFLPQKVKRKISESHAENIIFYIDESLVHIPWELLHDGKEFLCLKFSVGRNVRTSQEIYKTKYREHIQRLQALILADPTEDLEAAYSEGDSLTKQLDCNRREIEVVLKTRDVDRLYVKRKIRDYDIVHFAGHAEYDEKSPEKGGWVLSDGIFTAKDVSSLGSDNAKFPVLVFSNACQSGRTREWSADSGDEKRIHGLANAFVLSGAKCYLGTFSRVMDESCLLFSKEFYKNLLSGKTVGKSIQVSRQKLIEKFGKNSLTWSSYVLYGNPSTILFEKPVALGDTTVDDILSEGRAIFRSAAMLGKKTLKLTKQGFDFCKSIVMAGISKVSARTKDFAVKWVKKFATLPMFRRKNLEQGIARDLEKVFLYASDEDVDGLGKILGIKNPTTIAIINAIANNANNLVENISGSSQTYRNILKLVANRLKVKGIEDDTEEQIEIKIAQKALITIWDNLTPDQRMKMEGEFRKISQQYDKTGGLAASASIFGILTAASVSGFGVYLLATTTLGAISGAAGIALPFAVYTTMMSSISMIIGPVGWIGAGLFAVWQLTGPNYKKLIPAIIYISALRFKKNAAECIS